MSDFNPRPLTEYNIRPFPGVFARRVASLKEAVKDTREFSEWLEAEDLLYRAKYGLPPPVKHSLSDK